MSTQITSKGTIRENSAFKLYLYNPLGINYYIQLATPISDYLSTLDRTRPKVYQVLDAFDLFYFPIDKLAEHVKTPTKTLWQKLIYNAINNHEIQQLNKLTAGNYDLSIIAGYQFLKSIFKYSRWVTSFKWENMSKDVNEVKQRNQYSDEELEKMVNEVIRFARDNIAGIIKEYQEGKQAIESIQNLIPAGGGYTHEALSVLTFLERPHEWRRRVKLLKDLVNAFRKLSQLMPTSFVRTQTEFTAGSVMGVTALKHLREIAELLPYEYAFPKELLALRLITQSALVRQKGAMIEPIVFIDKSGSMAESMPNSPEAKISASAGLGLVLYRKFNAKIFLFDTEVTEVKPKDVIDTLLKIRADGGTRIDLVLETIKSMPRNKLFIVITDGIDEVDENLAKQVANTHKVVFCIIPPYMKYEWLKHFKVIEVKKVEDLVKALKV